MRTRFLPILFGVVFALTLFFAVAAGAQVQLQEVQQQQVPDNQQQILEVQQQTPNDQQQAVEVRQQQVLNNQGQAVAVQQQVGTLAVETQAQGCQGQKREFKVGPRSKDTDRDFHIEGDKFRVVYDVDFTAGDPSTNEFTLEISNGSKFFKSKSTGDNHEEFVIDEGPGDFTLDARLRPKGNGTYTITVYDCTKAESSNNNGGGGGGGGGGGDPADPADPADPVTPAQEGTSPETTTSDLNTADAALETTTANNPDSVRDADAFRCDFFLRAVRDDRGALRAQYQGDELIVQRFEQCLSEDVLADTIPDRKLPFTGGMPLLGLAAIGLVSLAVVATMLVAPTRRRR